MPPWFADPSAGHILNDRSLKQSDIEILARWADTGAAQGDPKDAPASIEWPEGWMIKPDIIVEGPTYAVPAHPKNNVIEWITVYVPTGFAKDTWITSVEIKPEHPEVTNHMCITFLPHPADVKHFALTWADKQRDDGGSALPDAGPTFIGGLAAEDCYLPGSPAIDYRPLHAAKLVPASSDIGMGLHYTPNGKDVTDHVRIGFTISKEPPARRFVSLSVSSPRDPKAFAIPPGDPNWASPPAYATFKQDAEVVLMAPHMHARGKDMTYTLEYPDGRQEVVLKVPRYDFNWQLFYQTSVRVPKGAKLRVDAHFDNSVNNPSNPDPNRTVYYGEMTWEEMMFGFFSVVVDPSADPKGIISSLTRTGGGS